MYSTITETCQKFSSSMSLFLFRNFFFFTFLSFLHLLFRFSSKCAAKARRMYITSEKLTHRNVDLDREKSELSFYFSFFSFLRVCACMYVRTRNSSNASLFIRIFTDGRKSDKWRYFAWKICSRKCVRINTVFVHFLHYTLISSFIMENYERCLPESFLFNTKSDKITPSTNFKKKQFHS